MIRAINPVRHEFTRMLIELLRSVDVAALPVVVPGSGSSPWALPTWPPPVEDRTRPHEQRFHVLGELTAGVPLGSTLRRRRCSNYYPAGGGIGWHTDSAQPGWRVYVHRLLDTPDEEQPNCEFWFGNKRFKEHEEFGGYVFEAGTWHAVSACTPRLVCGFEISSTFSAELINASA